MKRRIYTVTPGAPATIAPAERMTRCNWCSIAITPPIRGMQSTPDDIVTYQTRRICVRCGITAGVVEPKIVSDALAAGSTAEGARR